MGFFGDFLDGFRQGSEEEGERSARRQSYSTYRTSKDVAREMQREFESHSDSRLLNEVNSASNEEKRVIHDILLRRGYTKVGNNYRRR